MMLVTEEEMRANWLDTLVWFNSRALRRLPICSKLSGTDLASSSTANWENHVNNPGLWALEASMLCYWFNTKWIQHMKVKIIVLLRGCWHISSAKIRGSWTPPSPLCQQWSAFGLPPLPPSSAFVSICLTPLLYYYFLRRLVYMIKWRIFIC